MGLSAEEVRHAAALARLDLTEQEAEGLAAQLGEVLARIEELQEPAAPDLVGEGGASGPSDPSVGGSASLRADEPGADRLAAGPGSFAPGWRRGFFTVPRLSSHGGVDGDGREEVP